jgi:hypothetical protein
MIEVDLTHDEQLAYNRILWNAQDLIARTKEEQEDSLASAEELAQLLYTRMAIPQVRLDLFSKPELNLAGPGKSPLQALQSSGATTHDPAFLRHLHYFIHGPNLPAETIRGIEQILHEEGRSIGEGKARHLEFVRQQVRKHNLGAAAATEFEKLAHEIGLGRYAEEFRKAALSAKR